MVRDTENKNYFKKIREEKLLEITICLLQVGKFCTFYLLIAVTLEIYILG